MTEQEQEIKQLQDEAVVWMSYVFDSQDFEAVLSNKDENIINAQLMLSVKYAYSKGRNQRKAAQIEVLEELKKQINIIIERVSESSYTRTEQGFGLLRSEELIDNKLKELKQ
jgi:CRISPR/Cas system CSM-associated protein Csm2 small subunit